MLVIAVMSDYSPPGSSVHGILQARMLEWVAISSSRGSSQSRDWDPGIEARSPALHVDSEPPGKPTKAIPKQFVPKKQQLRSQRTLLHRANKHYAYVIRVPCGLLKWVGVSEGCSVPIWEEFLHPSLSSLCLPLTPHPPPLSTLPPCKSEGGFFPISLQLPVPN